jgi:protein-disulfide isomerase
MPAGIDFKGSPAVGDPAKAKVIVYEFSDFQCPVCKRAADELHPLLGTLVSDSEALVVFKQNPLEMHKNAKPAALATAAAHLQGKFWAMHDKLFELNHLLGDDGTYTSVATGLGLDLAKFDADRKGPEVLKRVMAEAKLATDLDARGTPSYFVNGKKQVGWGSAMGLKGMVDMEKREVEKLMAQGKSREEALRERIQQNVEKPELAAQLMP